MRILIFDRAAGNPYTRGLSMALRSLGHHVVLAGPAAIDAPDVTAAYPRFGMHGQYVRKIMDIPLTAIQGLRLIVLTRPEIIHFHWANLPDAFYARLAHRLSRGRIIYTSHVVEYDAANATRQAELVTLADRIIVHGPSQRSALVTLFPDAASRIHEVEHGNYDHVARRIERGEARRRLGLSPESVVFAFIGQIRRRKGIDVLLDAFALHRESGGTAALLIVGTATDELYYRTQAARASEVIWHVTRDQQPQELLDLVCSAATAVVLPFRTADQSGSVIFAMTHGRCVVTTAVGEVGRTIAGRGVLVSADSQSLAAALAAISDDPQRADELGSRARKYALETLSWHRVAVATESVYRAALTASPLPPKAV